MATKTLQINLADIEGLPIGAGNTITGQVWVQYSHEVRTTDGKVIPLNARKYEVVPVDGVVSFDVIPNDDATVVAEARGFTTRVGWELTYRAGGRPTTVRNYGTDLAILTADPATVQYTDKTPVQAVPPEFVSVDQLVESVDNAEASAAASALSAQQAAAAAVAPTDEAVSTVLANPTSDARTTLNEAYALKGEAGGKALVYLDATASFFGDVGNDFQTGQATAPTTTTAAVAAGATVLPVASAAGLSAGVVLVVNVANANQQLVVVQSVASNNVTVTPALSGALASGATVAPLWTNDSHLSDNGNNAFAYWIANAKDAKGKFVLDGGKTTLLGNSWFFNGGTVYADRIRDRIPGTTVVNAGVAGNTSTQMLARFDTDVPTDSKFVVFNEPGVNDIYQAASQGTQTSNLEKLVAKIRAIGAVPVYLGMVPLSAKVAQTALSRQNLNAQIGDGSAFPGIPASGVVTRFPVAGLSVAPNASSIGAGNNVFNATPTGTAQTAFGHDTLTAVTSGLHNTAFGNGALRDVVTGSENCAFGQGALASYKGSNTTAVGQNAMVLATTGDNNTAVGRSAGYAPNGATANATTTGIQNVFVGRQTGGVSATSSYGTAVGDSAVAASHATALGSGASATASGAVAIGRDSSGNAATSATINEFALGTANHTVKVAGRLNVATRTPASSADTQGQVGDWAADDNFVYVKTSTGWKRSALTAF